MLWYRAPVIPYSFRHNHRHSAIRVQYILQETDLMQISRSAPNRGPRLRCLPTAPMIASLSQSVAATFVYRAVCLSGCMNYSACFGRPFPFPLQKILFPAMFTSLHSRCFSTAHLLVIILRYQLDIRIEVDSKHWTSWRCGKIPAPAKRVSISI